MKSKVFITTMIGYVVRIAAVVFSNVYQMTYRPDITSNDLYFQLQSVSILFRILAYIISCATSIVAIVMYVKLRGSYKTNGWDKAGLTLSIICLVSLIPIFLIFMLMNMMWKAGF